MNSLFGLNKFFDYFVGPIPTSVIELKPKGYFQIFSNHFYSVDKKPEDYNLPIDYIYAKQSWGESFHKIYPAMAYGSAKAQCESDGSYLAIPRSEAENNFIASLLPNEDIWIGINDIANEGTFVAVDGSQVSWTKWDTGEPNNQNDEDAVEIWQGSPYQSIPKSWNDHPVDLLRKFVCLLSA